VTGNGGGVLETGFIGVTQQGYLKAIQYIAINVRGKRYTIRILADCNSSLFGNRYRVLRGIQKVNKKSKTNEWGSYDYAAGALFNSLRKILLRPAKNFNHRHIWRVKI
jgi:hypothetical protein